MSNDTKVDFSGLTNNSAEIFLEDAAVLFSRLNYILDNVDSVINDESKLKSSAIEYLWLAEIKKIAGQGKNDVIGMVRNLLTGKFQDKYFHIELIRKHDQELARQLERYTAEVSEDWKIGGEIYKYASNPNELAANIKYVETKTMELKEEKLRNSIRLRLALIKLRINEAEVIGNHLQDVEAQWNVRAISRQVPFYAERLLLYFRGGISQDRKQIQGLNEFKDEKLKRAISANKYIRELMQYANSLRSIQLQIEFINHQIAFLKTDLKVILEGDIQKFQWVKNDATADFFKNVNDYAAKFEKEFGNGEFADRLRSNKEKIGERPTPWLLLLTRMKSELEEKIRLMIDGKNSVIYNAQKSLVSIFESREQSLKALIGLQASEILNLLKEVGMVDDIIKAIEKGVKRIERTLKKLWIERAVKFIKLKGRIMILNFNIQHNLERLLSAVDNSREAHHIATKMNAFIKLHKHKVEITRRVKQLESKYIPHLFMVAFDLKRMEELSEELQSVQRLLAEKSRSPNDSNLVALKNACKQLLKLFTVLIDWLNEVKLVLEGIEIIQVKKGMGIFYWKHLAGQDEITKPRVVNYG